MRIFIFTLLFSCSLIASAQKITCPAASEISITEGWALTSTHDKIAWDGALAQDKTAIGPLLEMDLVRAEGINGHFIDCMYKNATLSNVAPIAGVCDPLGLRQNCVKDSCVVECNTAT